MEKELIKQIILDLFEIKIDFHKQVASGKWYEKKYEDCGFIQCNTIYGIVVENNRHIDFDIKIGSSPDSMVKTIITQIINKLITKRPFIKDGLIYYKTKEMIMNDLKTSDRVYNWIFYTALYGIGTFCFFMSDKKLKEAVEPLEKYLKRIGISYKNEYSEAHWVYRFVFDGDINFKNKILSEFKL